MRSFFVIARNSTLHLQGPGGRRAAGRPRARRALRARGQHPEGRLAGPHRRPAGRRDDRAPCLGRPLRRRRQRHLRAAGQGDRERGRRGRAEHPPGGDPPGPHQADELHHGLRPLSARVAALLQHDPRGLRRRAPAHQRGAERSTPTSTWPRRWAPTSAASRSASAGTSRTTSGSPCAWRARCSRRRATTRPACASPPRSWPTAPRTTRRRWARSSARCYLNPNSAQGYTGGGWVNAHAGRPAGRDRAFPPRDAPEPARPREGHRALRHRHELPDAGALRGGAELGRAGAAGDARLRLLAPGGDLRPGRAGPAGRGAGGGDAG